MDPARIAELLAPFLAPESGTPAPLAESQLKQISTYIDLLLRWNARINLTAVRTPDEIVTRHFGESLFAARQLFPPAVTHQPTTAPPSTNDQQGPERNHLLRPHLIDVGSGAGFPGLPIKIWAPQVRLTLIESNNKKVTFLREAIRALRLTNVDVFSGRAENFSVPPPQIMPRPSNPSPSPGHDRPDVATLRAVEQFDTVLPSAVRLLAPEGKLALLIGESQIRRAHQLAPSIEWREPIPVPLSNSRVLLLGYLHPQQAEPNQ